MRLTRHFQQRMSQRGISRDMVEIVLAYGVQNKERYILGRKEATKRLEQLQNESRILKKIIDKGGVAAVIDSDALITAYNYSGLSRGQK